LKTKYRKYSQDFSGNSKTDTSFGPACDINAIVRHYEVTGVDPHESRKLQATFGRVSSRTYDEAMRQAAEVDSAFASLPSKERAEHQNDPMLWLDSLEKTPPAASQEVEKEASPSPAEPAPQDTTEPESE